MKLITYCILGALIGVLTAYLRPFSPNTFWSLSDIVNCGGFWFTSVCVIIYLSRDWLHAGTHVLLYLLFMNLSYYLSLFFTIGIFYPNQLIFWSFISILCYFGAQLVFIGKLDIKYSALINALYLSGLLLETLSLMPLFIRSQTHFLQLAFDLFSLIFLYFMYNQTPQKKRDSALITFIIVMSFKCSLLLINQLPLGI